MKIIIAKHNLIIMQFIPIFLILVYAMYHHRFSKVSHSVLGKLFAVMMILYYTRMHFLYGTICCFIVIIYYMLSEVAIEGFSEIEERIEVTMKPIKETSLDDLLFDKPKSTSVITIDEFHQAKDEFIKEKCKNGVLMYKDLPVKTEMADHVYSEIKFNKKAKCNPCDRICDYNIVEAKLKTEFDLIPKSSKDLKI